MKRSSRSSIIATVTALLAATNSFGQYSPAQPHPDAPPETAQYAFLVGEWDCTIRSTRPNGDSTESKTLWRAHWILGGWAVQDEWIAEPDGGPSSWGTNIRSWDAQRGKWNNRWLASGALTWTHFDSEWIDGTMVMTGGEGRDSFGEYLDRNTFHNISKNHFDWRKDRSYDGGVTWIEGVAAISAERRR